MTLIGDVVAGFLLESIALAATWSLLALVAAVAFTWPSTRVLERTLLLRPWIGGLAGSVAAGSLAHRFGAAEPWLLTIGKRDLPVVWSLGGALIGAAVVTALAGRAAARLRRAAAAPKDSRGGDEGSPAPGARTPR